MEKKYIKDDLIIYWKPDVCIHSANCVKGLPNVFNPRNKPWVEQNNASVEELVNTIKTCPSGALSYSIENETKENKPDLIQIKINESGPIIIADGCVIDYRGTQIEKSGTVALCRCGHSENKPFCDGAHRKVGFDTK